MTVLPSRLLQAISKRNMRTAVAAWPSYADYEARKVRLGGQHIVCCSELQLATLLPRLPIVDIHNAMAFSIDPIRVEWHVFAQLAASAARPDQITLV